MRHLGFSRLLTVVGATLAVLGATATSVNAFTTTQGNAGTDPGVLVRFQGGIGVQPVSAVNANGTVVPNVVRDVPPPRQPWVIAGFNATVRADGRITAHGRGLVFAGGNTVGTALVIDPIHGTAAASLLVAATLICENTAPFTELSTGSVPLAANGDFTINGSLSSAPPAATDCRTPVLLIRNATGGNLGGWFAAGIQQNPPSS
jgi:hypothetical protein